MSRLPDELYARGEGAPLGRRRSRAIPLLALSFAGAALLVLGQARAEPLARWRWSVLQVLAPILRLTTEPLRAVHWVRGELELLIDGRQHIDRLLEDRARLRIAEARVRVLERRLVEAEALAGLARGIPHASVAGRAVAESRGPFRQSLLIDVGSSRGVSPGQAVIQRGGLVGRIVDVGPAAARVLALGDPASRIPVICGKAGVRAIAVGNGSETLSLQHLAQPGDLAEGDDVVTSGRDGGLPPGLLVGFVRLGAAGPRVEPVTRADAFDHLSIVLYEPPRLEPEDEESRRSTNSPTASQRPAPVVRGSMGTTSSSWPR